MFWCYIFQIQFFSLKENICVASTRTMNTTEKASAHAHISLHGWNIIVSKQFIFSSVSCSPFIHLTCSQLTRMRGGKKTTRCTKQAGVPNCLEGPLTTTLGLCPGPNNAMPMSSITDKNPLMPHQHPTSHLSSLKFQTPCTMNQLQTSWPSLSAMAVPFPLNLLPPNRQLLELNQHEALYEEITQDDAEVQEISMLSYEIHNQVQKRCLADMTTYRQYKLYIKDYMDWWEKREFNLMQQNPNWRCIPPMPITLAKVVLFLDYTMKWPKVHSPIHLHCI